MAHTLSPRIRVAVLLLLFGIGLAGSAALIRPHLPFPHIPVVEEKLAWLATHGDEYDTLFIGSSRTYGHIDPKLFDKFMAEAGMPTHSFNLALNGLRPPEDNYLLEKALSKRRVPLKFVIVECNKIHVPLESEHSLVRQRYWHDFKRMAILVRCTFRSWQFPNMQRLSEFGFNTAQYLANTLNVGRGLDWVEARLLGKKRLSLQEEGRRADGYEAHQPPDAIDDAEWNLLQTQLAAFFKSGATREYGDPESQRMLLVDRRLIEAHGGRMILFIPPLAGGREFAPDPQFKANIPVLDFADPRRYPDLFVRAHRADAGHLNQQGAEIFTRLLVQRLLELKGK